MTDVIRFETAAIHTGQEPDPATGAAVVPIYQTSTYVQEAVGRHRGYEYSRTDNPTRRALETCLAALEGARFAVAFSSGMAAIDGSRSALGERRKVVIPDDGYGGTYRLFDKVMAEFGVPFEMADMSDESALAQGTGRRCRAGAGGVSHQPAAESAGSQDDRTRAHEAGALFVVDNTFATPYLQRPLELDADAVVYSATKYLGGHSDLVMGAVTTSDEALAGRLKFLQNAVGAVPGPFDSWLLLRGLKTLALRMRAHSAGAAAVAGWLSRHSDITQVRYPGLGADPGHALASAQMNASGTPLYGGMVSVELVSESRALQVCERTRLFFLGESLGGVESLIEHPARMTHASLEGSGAELSPGFYASRSASSTPTISSPIWSKP